MRELWDQFSDPDSIIALSPEELGEVVLFILKSRKENKKNFSVHNEISSGSSGGDVSRGTAGCPPDYMFEVQRVLAEAFSWLETSGFMVPAPLGQGDFHILTRRAEAIKSRTDLSDFVRATSLPKALLHKTLRDTVWVTFLRRDYETAVFQSMRAVEIAVREAAGYDITAHGVPMVRKAFTSKVPLGPLADPQQPTAEAEALEHLFAGAIGSYKNPHSHRKVELNSAEEAAEIILLASHLLKIVDARRASRTEGRT
jgi:uncharacterized protein (TIGR02391 family)